MKYIVQISELLSHRIKVEAESVEQAKQQAINAYYDGDVVLTSDDYVDGSVQFEVIENG